MFSSCDKVALITGGLGGIGLAIAKELLKDGAKGVVLLDVDGSSARKILNELQIDRNRVLFLETDVTKEGDVIRAFETTVTNFGQLDIVINCAGIVNEKDWEKCVNVNFVALLRITKLAYENYLPKYSNGEGVIVNISSIMGLEPGFDLMTYCSTKSAIITVGRSYGLQTSQNKIRVLTICPGKTETNLLHNFMKTMCLPEEMRNAIIALPAQKPEDLAKKLIPVLKNAKTGSVWAAEDGEKPAYEIEFPSYGLIN